MTMNQRKMPTVNVRFGQATCAMFSTVDTLDRPLSAVLANRLCAVALDLLGATGNTSYGRRCIGPLGVKQARQTLEGRETPGRVSW